MTHVIETGLSPIIAPPPTNRESNEFALAWVDQPAGVKPRIRLDAPDENRPMYLMYRCGLPTLGIEESGWGFTPLESYQNWVRLCA